jgi:hypothetical protein
LANRFGSVLILGIVWGLDTWAGDFAIDSGEGVYVSRVAVRASVPGDRAGDYAAVIAMVCSTSSP